MRLGSLFRSRSSLIAKLASREASAAEFLRRLEGRQEWAAKLYVAAGRDEPQSTPHAPREGVRHAERDEYVPRGGDGTQYLAVQVQRAMRRRQSEAAVKASGS